MPAPTLQQSYDKRFQTAATQTSAPSALALVVIACTVVAAMGLEARALPVAVFALLSMQVTSNNSLRLRFGRMDLGIALTFGGLLLIAVIAPRTKLPLLAEEAAKFACYLAFSLAITKASTAALSKALTVLVTILVLSTIALAPSQAPQGRLEGVMSHPNHLAYFAAALSAAVYSIPHRTQPLRLATLQAGIFLVILLTKSTGAIATFMTISMIYSWKAFDLSSSRRSLAIVAGTLLAATLFALSDASTIALEKLSQVDTSVAERKSERLSFGGYGSATWRLAYWRAIITHQLYESTPTVLLGAGPGIMGKGNYAFSFMRTDPHNDFIRIFVEYGILGLSLFTAMLLSLWLRSKSTILLIALVSPMAFGNVWASPAFILTTLISCHLTLRSSR